MVPGQRPNGQRRLTCGAHVDPITLMLGATQARSYDAPGAEVLGHWLGISPASLAFALDVAHVLGQPRREPAAIGTCGVRGEGNCLTLKGLSLGNCLIADTCGSCRASGHTFGGNRVRRAGRRTPPDARCPSCLRSRANPCRTLPACRRRRPPSGSFRRPTS